MKNAIVAFGRAVFWGSLAGGGPFLMLTVPVALQASDWWQMEVIWLAMAPFMIAGAVVVLAAIFLGLPLTAWLAHKNDEARMTYVIAGLGLGVLLPIALIPALSGGWVIGAFLAIPGAIAGTVTGAVWGGWREQVADRRAQP